MYNDNPRTKLPLRFIIPLIIFGILIISVVVIFILSPKDQPSEEETEFDTNVYDVTDLDETMSDSFANATKSNPYNEYETTISETKFSDLTAQEFCTSQNLSCSNILSQSLTKIPAINSNALNYYLDNNFAVVIVSSDSTTIIYGAIYTTPVYLTFSTTQTDYDDYGYKSKVEIFNQLTGSEAFYTFSPST
ncbi:hypothetical protein IKG20_02495 [Candidatus Saccharibacteria bacterium]|nr:hypothetical protein [Candidatus Saccharibacteria bacterium]